MKNKNRIIKALWVLGLLVMGMLAVAGGFAIDTDVGSKPPSGESAVELSKGWTLIQSSGSMEVTLPLELKTDEKTVTIQRQILPDQAHGMMIKMPTNRQGVTVYADDQQLYQVNTTHLSRMVMVKNDVLISLPMADQPFTLRIVFSNLSGGKCKISPVVYGSRFDMAYGVIEKQIVTVVNLIVLMVLMVFMLVIVVYFLIKKRFNGQLLCLSGFLLALIGWTLTDSPLAALSSFPLEYCGIICFFCLMLLPQAIVFFTIVTLKKPHKSLYFVAGLIFLNILCQAALSMTGVMPLNKMLYATHGTLAATILAGTYCVVQERREIPETRNIYLFAGLNLMSAVAMVSAVSYWIGAPDIYRLVMLVGTSLFFVVQVIGVLHTYSTELQENRSKITELEMFERFSHIDSLTGLGNRRAFEEKMEEIENKLSPSKDALLFMLDLNGLKYTNDSFGHAAGDELIASAACCIREAFGVGGFCYRIGGDEFAVLLPEATNPDEYNSRLTDAINRSNVGAAVKLSIARGSSHLLLPSGERKSMSNWKQEADVNMYMNKTAHRRGSRTEEEQEMRDIISCVVAAVEARDRYTANHSNRVSELSRFIAQRLGLSPKTVAMVREAALLHDIGKIAIPDSILRKESDLSEEEYEIIKRHATMGGEIVANAKSMEEIASVITHHHERFDGTGYPDKLAAQNIPIGSRIIAVADSIDAMTSERSYRHALTLDRCRQEILNNMGKAYDPAVAQIVLDSWADVEKIVLLHSKFLPRLGNTERD